MIPRVPLREALSDPNLLGTAIAGDSWRSWRTPMGEALGEDERRDACVKRVRRIRHA
jgi:hypothetical protein